MRRARFFLVIDLRNDVEWSGAICFLFFSSFFGQALLLVLVFGTFIIVVRRGRRHNRLFLS